MTVVGTSATADCLARLVFIVICCIERDVNFRLLTVPF